jgi:alpha-glucosidase
MEANMNGTILRVGQLVLSLAIMTLPCVASALAQGIPSDGDIQILNKQPVGQIDNTSDRYITVGTKIHLTTVETIVADASSEYPPVTAPPESFFELVQEKDRAAARRFYKKHIDVGGMPVVAAGEVADEALQRTYSIVTHMLAGRSDIVEALVENQMYLIVIGKDQVYTDMPEYRNARNPTYLNERVRGTGGRPTSFGEENLLGWPIHRCDDESIAVHEFCHTIDGALRSFDPIWNARKNALFRTAIANGLWKNTYTASNPGEYWAEIAQAYFDCQRVNNWNHGPIGTHRQPSS